MTRRLPVSNLYIPTGDHALQAWSLLSKISNLANSRSVMEWHAIAWLCGKPGAAAESARVDRNLQQPRRSQQ